jgi:hypothetical protein
MRISFTVSASAVFSILASATPGSGAILYVDPGATGANNGSSWTNAYTSLSTALNAATANVDEVWVKDGTYKPGTARADSFVVKQGVQVYGGFAGSETARSQRVQTAGDTVLSGDIGTIGVTSDNSYHIVTSTGKLNSGGACILDGFQIELGNAAGATVPRGAAVFGPLLYSVNCIFYGNTSPLGGGAACAQAHASGTVLEFHACWFDANTGGSGGPPTGFNGAGAIEADANGCAVAVHNSLFTNNSNAYFGGKGGAVANRTSSNFYVNSCTFYNNNSTDGASIYSATAATTHVRNCICKEGVSGSSTDPIDWAGSGSGGMTVLYTAADDASLSTPFPSGTNIFSNLLDPGFADPATGNFRLIASSPCIDVGDKTSATTDTFDVDNDGNTTEKEPDLDRLERVVGCGLILDMGAYEFFNDCQDLSNDGSVDSEDLALLLGEWGSSSSPADFDCDGDVDGTDLAILLGGWNQSAELPRNCDGYESRGGNEGQAALAVVQALGFDTVSEFTEWLQGEMDAADMLGYIETVFGL